MLVVGACPDSRAAGVDLLPQGGGHRSLGGSRTDRSPALAAAPSTHAVLQHPPRQAVHGAPDRA
eukprot:1147139-Pelagomonas_calceolata.AAC.4